MLEPRIGNFPSHTVIKVYKPNNELLGYIDREIQLYDLQLQICEADISGYTYVYVDNKYNEHKGTINNNGELSEWFDGMFDISQIILDELYSLRKKKNSNTNEFRYTNSK